MIFLEPVVPVSAGPRQACCLRLSMLLAQLEPVNGLGRYRGRECRIAFKLNADETEILSNCTQLAGAIVAQVRACQA